MITLFHRSGCAEVAICLEETRSVPESEFINHLVDEFGMIAVDLVNAKPGRVKLRIDILLAVDTGGIKSNPFGAHVLRQYHLELKALIDCQRILTHHLEAFCGDINQMADQLLRVAVEKTQIIDQVPSFKLPST